MKILATVFLFSLTLNSSADNLRIAVASNFSHSIKAIASQFEAQSPHKLNLVFGATGRHFAQIVHGAPFDVFLAADNQRPKKLEAQGIGVKNSRFTYAIGQVVLWSPKPDWFSSAEILNSTDFKHLAIANPKLAPYGKAAAHLLKQRGLWQGLQARMVRGENIAQAYQFVQSGNAELGFVAYAQVKNKTGSFWRPAPDTYPAIEQQALLLKDSPAARDFIRYLQTPAIKALIRKQGYETP